MAGASSTQHVQHEMNARVLATLPVISVIFALVYAVYAALHGRFLAPEAARVMTPLAAATSGWFALQWLWLTRASPAAHWAHPATALSVLLISLNVLLHIHLVQAPHETLGLLFVIFGIGSVVLSLRWFAGLLSSVVIGWAVVVSMAEPSPHWGRYAFAILGASLLATVIETTRVKILRRYQLAHDQAEVSNARLHEKVVQLEDLCRVLDDQAEVIHQDLKRAEVIQRALLPNAPPTLPGYSVTTLYRPGRNIGGDFYDVRRLDDRYAAFVIADAAGHGVAAAMLSVLFKLCLRMSDEETGEPLAPRRVLEGLNRHLLADVSASGLFVTAAYALLDMRTGRLCVASAGHPPSAFVGAGGTDRMLERSGPALGLYAEASYEETSLQLEKGDRVFFYTDGLLDAGAGMTAPEALAAEISRRDLPNSKLLRALHAKVEGSEDASDRDDLTLMLIEAGEADSHFDVMEPGPAGPATPVETKAELSCGESVAAAFIRVAGRVTWMRSQAFHDAACVYLENGRTLILDFGECEYLDSTLLGTIHEIVVRGGAAVRLQGVRAKVRQLFEELSMHTVLEHVQPSLTGLPATMNPLFQTAGDTERRPLRVLHAHQVLSSLSEDNREQFRVVVESLQRELEASGDEARQLPLV